MSKFFRPEHLYGLVLEFLYNQPDTRFDLKYLQQHFKCDAVYLQTQLDKLVEDKLIFKSADLISTKTGGNHPTYGLAYEGFKFISELENIRKVRSHSHLSIVISVIALIITVGGIFIQSYISPPVTNVNNYIRLDSLSKPMHHPVSIKVTSDSSVTK